MSSNTVTVWVNLFDDDRQHHNLIEQRKRQQQLKTKIHQEFFLSDFDILSETLEDIIEGHVASQGQLVGSRREPGVS